MEKLGPYGIEYNKSTDVLTRIGDMDAHRILPVQSQMHGVIINDLGEEVCNMPESDWTSIDRSGTLGQVMVKVPEHWMKFDVRNSGANNRVWLSAKPISGFLHIPTYYVSAYEASLQRSTSKLSSVVNTTTDYRGGNNTSSLDGTYRSLLGMPATYISMTDLRTYARNRNNGDTRWNQYTYQIHRDLVWLYFIEYCSFNSQDTFSDELTSKGFHQGGLGPGVTTVNSSDWNSYNGYNPFVPCGTTDTLGNRTGVKNYSATASDGTSVWHTVSVPRYRGIENPFGHIWKWTDGVVTGSTNDCYVCEIPALYSSTSYSNYYSAGTEARTNNYIKNITFGSKGDIFATEVGSPADATHRYCDYHYVYTSSQSLRAVYFGGSAAYGSDAGLLCSLSSRDPSSVDVRIGSRLTFFM